MPLRDPEDVDLLDAGGRHRFSRHAMPFLSSRLHSSDSTSSSSPRSTSTSQPPQAPQVSGKAGSSRLGAAAPAAARGGNRLQLQLGALGRRALGDEREGEGQRVGHDLAQVPDLHVDARRRGGRRRARGRCRTIDFGDRELVHQQILGSGSPTSWSITRAPAERGRHQHHPGRLGPHLADLGRALAAGRGAQRGERRVGVLGRDARPRACPRWRRTSGRCRGSRPRRPRPGRTGHVGLAHDHRHARRARELVETDATPPRVASRRQRRPGPAASSSASTAGHSERVSRLDLRVELELAAGEHDRRAVLADRAGHEQPVAGAQRARATGARAGRARRRRWCRCTCRRPCRARRPSCRRRRPRRPPPARRPRIASTSALQRLRGAGPPRGRARAVSASGRAPAMARSLTVPLTASSPIEPPGKRSGLTTKLSVVSASSRRRRPHVAARRRARPSASLRERRDEQALDQRLRRLAAGAVGHRDLRVAELRRAWRGRSR